MAYIKFKAPGLFLRISSIASNFGHPLWIRARATRRGARPSPATQWTPIFGYCYCSYSLSCFYLLLCLFFVFSRIVSSYFSLSYNSFLFLSWKKESTILNHFLIISLLGGYPSWNSRTVTAIPFSIKYFSSYVFSQEQIKCLTLSFSNSLMHLSIELLSGDDIIIKLYPPHDIRVG